MILYFANRNLDVIGSASDRVNNRYVIISDKKTESIESGNSSFSFSIVYEHSSRLEVEELVAPGNYVFRYDGNGTKGGYSFYSSNDFFIITETETDSQSNTVSVYAESGSLDLLNDIAYSYESEVGKTAAEYVTYFLGGVGSTGTTFFKVGVNELPDKKLAVSWSSNSTVLNRLLDVADTFGCDIDFTYDLKGFKVVNSYVNIRISDNKERDIVLYMNKDVTNITVTRSIADMATAIYPSGNDISLSDYTGSYDDGDIYLADGWLYSRKALENWHRVTASGDSTGHIYKTYSYETSYLQTLLDKSVEELKRISEPIVTYEVDIDELPEEINVGDRINIVDDNGGIYISARVLQLETSITQDIRNATLGDYKKKSSGISDKVIQLASEFSEKYAQINTKIDNLSLNRITNSDLDGICV